MSNDTFSVDFIRGQQDCRQGIEHKPGQTDAYNRGYSTYYELQAINDHKTGVKHGQAR